MWWHDSIRILNWPLDPVQRNNASIKSLILDLTALQSLFPEQAQISHCSLSSHLPTELMEETLQEQEQNSWYNRVFTTSALIKKPSQNRQSRSGGGRAHAREISHGWFYSYFKAFSQEPGCQPGCRSNQYNQRQTQNWGGKNIIICLSYFFLYIEWVLDVIWRQTEHLFLGLDTQHTREC